MSTLIIPCAGQSTRYPGVRPKWMLTYPDGQLMIQKAIEGLEFSNLERTVVTTVREHCDKYDADIVIKQALGDHVEVCILDEFTHSQSDTIAHTINKMNIRGGFVSRDSDSYVKVPIDKYENFVVGVNIENYLELSNVSGKSFIILNDQNLIIDIIEKKVSSNLISIGIYGFKSAEEFVEIQQTIKKASNTEDDEIYPSHIISYMLGLNRFFHYKEAIDYEDWGLLSDWRKSINRRKTFFLDVDGVIFKNKGQYGRVNWNSHDEPLENNIETIKLLAKKGAQIIFCTARTEEQREKLEKSLKSHGIEWHSIIMGCNHSQRVLVNDYSGTNPFPSCSAISIPRDIDNLGEFFQI